MYCNSYDYEYHELIMGDLISFSFRVPRDLAAGVKAAAKQLGVSRSEYTRRALEQFQAQQMQVRMAELSHRVARESADAARSMEGSGGDGLA
jgi:predicted transcriptional regulator